MSKRPLSLKRTIRHRRVRSIISGTAYRPRLVVFRSLAHVEAQIIDDIVGKTLVAVHDRQIKVKGTKTMKAQAVGTAIAEQALLKKITTVVFDRGGFKYHGRIKALADAARAGGLMF